MSRARLTDSTVVSLIAAWPLPKRSRILLHRRRRDTRCERLVAVDAADRCQHAACELDERCCILAPRASRAQRIDAPVDADTEFRQHRLQYAALQLLGDDRSEEHT